MDKISALMDGELDDLQAQQQLGRISQDRTIREAWEAFHLIGDAMRGERALSSRFSSLLAERMMREPTVLAPRPRVARRLTSFALSAAASIAAVAAVGWIAFFNSPPALQTELAKAPVAPLPAPAPSAQLASVPNDGKMSEYLIAHQEFSPSTAIQGVAPYIRSVSSTQPVAAGQ